MNASLKLSLDPIDQMLLATDCESNHSIRVPFSINGLRVLKAMLQAQELHIAAEKEGRKIASNSMPTQHMVDAFLKNRALEKANEAEKEMQELKELFS